jgi:hypothetical protein
VKAKLQKAVQEEQKLPEPDNSKKKPGRGRKKQSNDDYITKTQEKIDEVIEEYRLARLGNTSSQEKKKLRNKKTAMESRVREKKKMNEMIDLIESQHDKLEQIQLIISKEIKTTPGLLTKINQKLGKLEVG